MPVFFYEGVGESGRPQRGQVTAADERLAYLAAEALGVTVIRLGTDDRPDQHLPWYRRDLLAGPGRLTFSEQSELASQFAVLFKARLPVSEIVRIVAGSCERPFMRDAFGRVERLVADGATLSQAFGQINTRASPLFLSVLRLADTAAQPADALEALAQFFRRQDRVRRQVAGALIYPSILVVGAVGVLLLISLFLAPNLAPMFEALGQPVPASIGGFLSVGAFLTENGLLLATLSLMAGLGMALSWPQPAVQTLRRHLCNHVPVLGPAMRAAELSHLVRCVELLLRSGEPLPEAFRQAATSFGGPAYRKPFERAAEALEHGDDASSALSEAQSMPLTFLQFFQVGEKTNMLPEVLPILAADLDDRVEKLIDRAMKLLTPVITLVVGGGIALLVYAVMSAILSVNDLAG